MLFCACTTQWMQSATQHPFGVIRKRGLFKWSLPWLRGKGLHTIKSIVLLLFGVALNATHIHFCCGPDEVLAGHCMNNVASRPRTPRLRSVFLYCYCNLQSQYSVNGQMTLVQQKYVHAIVLTGDMLDLPWEAKHDSQRHDASHLVVREGKVSDR
jgi:hypothetical protein